MRDRRKELIRQWFKEPTVSEHEIIERNCAGASEKKQTPQEYTRSCHRQKEREELISVEGCRPINPGRSMESRQYVRRWYEPRRINNHDSQKPHLDFGHESSKYSKMLLRFLESENRVFCFPPHLNSFERMLVHVEAGKLGLEHRSCGQGWERFMVVTKPGIPKETVKEIESGGKESEDAEEWTSTKLSCISGDLPSLASKLSQVTGRCTPKDQCEIKKNEMELKNGTELNEVKVCEDDQNQPHMRKEAHSKERVQATVPSSTLPDDPSQIQSLRAEFEERALIYPDEDEPLPDLDESVLPFSADSAQRHSTLKDAAPGDEVVQKPISFKDQSLKSDQCTLAIPTPEGTALDDILLQKVTEDLAWFENLVSVRAVGQVVQAVFGNEEFANAALLGLKAKYPGIFKKADLVRHPSSGLFTLSFIDTERLRYRATLHHFSAFGEVPVVLRGSKRDEVTIGFKTEDAASLALSVSKELPSFTDIKSV